MLGDQGQSLWLEAQGRWVPSTGRTQDSLCWGQAAWPRRPQQGQGGWGPGPQALLPHTWEEFGLQSPKQKTSCRWKRGARITQGPRFPWEWGALGRHPPEPGHPGSIPPLPRVPGPALNHTGDTEARGLEEDTRPPDKNRADSKPGARA